MNKTAIILLTLLTLAACRQKPIEIPVNADLPFKHLLSAYTSGIVAKKVQPTLHFKTDLPASVLGDSLFIKQQIETTPSFDFSVVTTAKSIKIIPKTLLKNGIRYRVNVNVAKLTNTKLDTDEFPMVFEIQNQDYTIQSISTTPNKMKNLMDVSIIIKTNDETTLDKVQSILKNVKGAKKKDILWTKVKTNTYALQLKNVERTNENKNISFQFNGASIGAKRVETRTIKILAKEEFKLNNWVYDATPDQVLRLEFSTLLDADQQLEGLLELEHFNKINYLINDNVVTMYLHNSHTGAAQLTIHPGIKGYDGYKTKKRETIDVVIDEPMPMIEMIGEGTILPNSQGLIVPFKTIGLKKVDVNIIRIHEKNILQFLQINTISECDELRRVGETIATHTIDLEKTNKGKLKQWTTNGLNLRDIIKPEPGAIYRVRFSFKKAYTFTTCEEEIDATYYDEFYNYYDNSNIDQIEEYDQCNSTFYYRSTKSKNLLASDLGLITKKGDGETYTIISTNLINGEAQPGTTLKFYNFAQKRIKTAITNAYGVAKVSLPETPFVVIAENDQNKAYLKLNSNYANSLSKFETEGEKRNEGVSAYFYGERGVWRPGDDIYLSMILNDTYQKLADGMPMKLTLTDPQNRVVQTQNVKLTTTGIQSIKLSTDQNAPTGTYTATATVGSYSFQKNLKIETIRPNRLKIHLKTASDDILGYTMNKLELSSAWLHGANAGALNAKVNMILSPMSTSFEGYRDYTFEDLSVSPERSEQVVYDAPLKEDGKATIELAAKKIITQGKLKASFVTKVFEKGGGFSIDNYSTIYHPYSGYLGIKLPINDYGYLTTGKRNIIQFANLDVNGTPISKKDTIMLKIYKVEWSWWWQHNEDDIANYLSNYAYNQVLEQEIYTEKGKCNFLFETGKNDWGQYFIQATNTRTGHSTSQLFFADYYGSSRNQKNQDNATLVTLKADKESYNVGEEATISFPCPTSGKTLVSIENDVEVVKTFWVSAKKGAASFKLKLDASMSPNCYVHITVLQKHLHEQNDQPLRMYGVIPIVVFDKNKVLNPLITMKDEILPERNSNITVSEKSGRGMHYTLAIVDEGLLDLTRFRTPRVWEFFNKKRALGVSTWDVYDDVINSFSGKFSNVYSVGGDDEGGGGNVAKANRFKPVVKFLGPFYLKPGQKTTHTFKIENYVGSVRAMVVCRNNDAFGKAEHTAAVKKPLMIQANAPRSFSLGDEIEIPITVFANEKAKLPITVKIQADKHLSFIQNSYTISKVQNGEAMLYAKARVTDKLGFARLTFIANCANDRHDQTLTVPIKMPGYEITEVQDQTISTGQSFTFNFKQLGWDGTNSAVLEVSQYPSINLEKRLKYLMQYPHGCIEQTTSSIFPQLFLADLMELTPKQQKEINYNITMGIDRIQKFVTMEGGFAYWPGQTETSEWGSNYAGHFLLEAKAKGYYVPEYLIAKWTTYQETMANNFNTSQMPFYRSGAELNQAYRLYTLALAGKTQLGAMNRLKEFGLENSIAKWRLASAYALAGQQKTAKILAETSILNTNTLRDDYYTYGSLTRDNAILLECMQILNPADHQLPVTMKEIAAKLGSNDWLSTQETAYSLCAFAKVVKTTKGQVAKYSVAENGKAKKNITLSDVLNQYTVEKVGKKNYLSISNTGTNILFVRLINSGIPPSTSLTNSQNKLQLSVHYFNEQGKQVSGDSLVFGKDYNLTVQIQNMQAKQVNNIALSLYIPAGCEIQNDGMADVHTNAQTVTHEDIRDDKILAYFNLNAQSTKTLHYKISASYKGTFLNPGVHCEAMYDASIYALEKGRYIRIE